MACKFVKHQIRFAFNLSLHLRQSVVLGLYGPLLAWELACALGLFESVHWLPGKLTHASWVNNSGIILGLF